MTETESVTGNAALSWSGEVDGIDERGGVVAQCGLRRCRKLAWFGRPHLLGVLDTERASATVDAIEHVPQARLEGAQPRENWLPEQTSAV